MAVRKRYFCVEHGFVDPKDELVPECPDCGLPASEVGGAST